jgi:hypothetical protein
VVEELSRRQRAADDTVLDGGRRPSEVADGFQRVYNIGRSVPSGFFNEQDSPCSLSF